MKDSSYFKLRSPFNFNPHPYEIGNLFFYNKKLENNFFFNKLGKIPEDEYLPYFYFHRDHYLLSHKGQEKQFVHHLLKVTQHRIEHYRQKDLYRGAENTLDNLYVLDTFKDLLIGLDEWNLHKSLEMQLAEKDIEIATYKTEIKVLTDKLKESKEYDVDSKVRTIQGFHQTLIHLFVQIQDLELPDGRKLCKSQSQSAWYKMISKYFQNGEKNIPINTVRNYFPAEKDTVLIKGTDIDEKYKIFQIILKPNE